MKQTFGDNDKLGKYVADQIEELISEKPNALICIAAGTSSLPVFNELVERVKTNQLSFNEASFIAMDEWVNFSINDDGSMGDFLTKHFLKHVNFKEVFLFDGMGQDYEAESKKAEEFIKDRGIIDYIILGLGMNGHIALNEPGTQSEERTHFVRIDSVTANVGKKYFKTNTVELTGGITLGIANVLEAGKVVLIANSPNKHEIVKRFEKTDPSSELPATYLKEKESFEFLITNDVLHKQQ